MNSPTRNDGGYLPLLWRLPKSSCVLCTHSLTPPINCSVNRISWRKQRRKKQRFFETSLNGSAKAGLTNKQRKSLTRSLKLVDYANEIAGGREGRGITIQHSLHHLNACPSIHPSNLHPLLITPSDRTIVGHQLIQLSSAIVVIEVSECERCQAIHRYSIEALTHTHTDKFL